MSKPWYAVFEYGDDAFAIEIESWQHSPDGGELDLVDFGVGNVWYDSEYLVQYSPADDIPEGMDVRGVEWAEMLIDVKD